MGEIVNLSSPGHVRNLCEGLWNLCGEKFKTDFQLDVNSNASFSYSCHSLILAAQCPKLKNFQNCSFIFESGISLNEEDLNLIMEYAYLGKIKVEEERLPRLRAGADALGMESLLKLIDNYTEKKVNKTKRKVVRSAKALKDGDESNLAVTKRTSYRGRGLNEPEVMIEESGTFSLDNLHFAEEDNTLAEDDDDESEASEYTPDKKPRKSVTSNSGKRKIKKGRQHKRHYAFDATRNEYVCQTCDKGFGSVESYCRHTRTHNDKLDVPVHKCPQCEFQTTIKFSWKTHLAAVHHLDPQGNILSKNIKCPQCDYTCVSMFQLKNHNYFKHATKKYICSECGYSCMRKSEFEIHMRGKHRNERPFMCELCGYRGKCGHNLKCHMRTHTGEKPFVCKICGQGFALTGTLKSHLETHDPGRERPYPCHLCQFASRKRYSLKFHYHHVHKIVFNNNDEFVKWYTQLRTQTAPV